MGSDDLGGIPAGGYHRQQEALHPQDERQPRALQVLSALEILGCQLKPSAFAALIGGFEETDGLHIQETLVVGSTLAALSQRLFGSAIRIFGIVESRQF